MNVSALWVLPAALCALPVLLPLSQPPIVTAVAELAAAAIAGIVAMALGLRAWKTAPLRIAGLNGTTAPGSIWPHLLVCSAAWAGLLSAVIAVLQVLAPEVLQGPLGSLIEPSHLLGRAVGHVRQPNHLATLVLWGAIGTAALSAHLRMNRWACLSGIVLLITALVLTGSRTGLLGLVVLVGWALIDEALPRSTRLVLLSTPIMALLVWWAMQVISAHADLAFGASTHLTATRTGDISSSRFAIWRNTWALITSHPWTGVGWGRFNVAWTLTPMEGRPTALFDHAHNLPLHLMAELGVPLGLALSAVLATLLFVGAHRQFGSWADIVRQWRGFKAGTSGPGPSGDQGLRRAAVVMLGVVALHSLLEYPLWYAYFGLPAAACLFVTLNLDRPWPRAARWQALGFMVVGAGLLTASVWACIDYQKVRAIYAPTSKAAPLKTRMAIGQANTWFADHAHYAVATNTRPIPGQPWAPELERAFERAPMVLLDARLMMAWAQALAARNGPGDLDRARHLAQRLREFNPPAARDWLTGCRAPQAPPELPTYPCESPSVPLTWRDFVR